MKKIRLNVANLDATEILSREQLKLIFGGDGSGSGSSGSTHNDGASPSSPTCTNSNLGTPCSYTRWFNGKTFSCTGTCQSNSVTLYYPSCYATCKEV